ALATAGDHRQALLEVDKLAAGKLSAMDLYNLACICSRAAAAISRDDKLAEAERQKSADETAARAVAFLAQAQAAGDFKDAKNLVDMKKDADLEPLRARADVKKLPAELEQAKP